MSANPKIPRLILSGKVFAGQAAVSRERNLASLARFGSPDAIREYLAEAAKVGYGGLMTLVEGPVIAALRRMDSEGKLEVGRDKGFQVLPIVPNVPSYVREATEYGMAGAGLRRLARVGVMGFVRASLVGAMHPGKVLKKDFATLIAILCELEMSELRRFAPPAVFLHQTMTDLALAFNNREFFESYAELIRNKYKTEPALLTANFVHLARKLRDWNVPISVIAAPLNQSGFLMPEGIDAYKRVLSPGSFTLIADRVALESPAPKEAIEWALAQPGVVGAVVEEV